MTGVQTCALRSYREMDKMEFVHRALEIVSDDGSQKNNDGNSMKIYSDDEEVKKILEDLFFERLDINNELWSVIYETCKMGDNFYEVIVDDYKKPKKIVYLRYLEPTKVERVEENGKIICDKVKITYDPDEINRYLSQEFCLKGWDAGKEYSNWCHDVEKVVPVKKGKLNLGLIIETKITNIDAHQKDVLENEEEQQFSEMVKINKDKYNVIDKGSFIKAAEEHKISLYGITDNDILRLGKLLNLDVLVHRLINKNNRTTKVRKINTGKVLLFNTYETVSAVSETDSSEWVKYGEDKRGTLHYYKKGNVNQASDIIKVLNKWVFSKREISDAIQYRRENRSSTKGYNNLSHMVYLSEIDCPNQSERMMYLFLYDADGKSLYSHTFSNPEWTLIQPESNGDTIRKAVCK